MNKLRFFITALIIFDILVGLLVTINGGLVDAYGITETDLQATEEGGAQTTIISKLNNLFLIQGITTVSEALIKIVAPTNVDDVVGSLIAVATGALQTIVGFVTTPLEVMNIFLAHFQFPTVIVLGMNALVITFVAFLLISARLRYDV